MSAEMEKNFILFKLTTECLRDTEQPLVVMCNTTEVCILLDLIQGQESQQENPDPVLQKQWCPILDSDYSCMPSVQE